MEAEADGSSLVVQGVEPGDAGLYTCQVSALTPVLIQHRLTVRTRPVIQARFFFLRRFFRVEVYTVSYSVSYFLKDFARSWFTCPLEKSQVTRELALIASSLAYL